MGGPDPGRPERTSFNKRNRTMFRKAHELAALCGANVYVLIDHPRARTVYNSMENAHWPPPDKSLVTFWTARTSWLLADKTQVDMYPDLQRLLTSTMDQSRLNSPPATGPRRRSPNQHTACEVQMEEAGFDRSQGVTQTKLSRKAGRPRKPQQQRQRINTKLKTMTLPRLPTRPYSQQHSESGYSAISQSMDIPQQSQTYLPPSQDSSEKNTQSDGSTEGTFEPDYPRIPVTKLLN